MSRHVGRWWGGVAPGMLLSGCFPDGVWSSRPDPLATEIDTIWVMPNPVRVGEEATLLVVHYGMRRPQECPDQDMTPHVEWWNYRWKYSWRLPKRAVGTYDVPCFRWKVDVGPGEYMLSVLISRLDKASEPVGGGFFVTVVDSLSR